MVCMVGCDTGTMSCTLSVEVVLGRMKIAVHDCSVFRDDRNGSGRVEGGYAIMRLCRYGMGCAAMA